MAEPVIFADPQGGGDYFTDATKLSQLVDANGGNAQASVPVIPYFEEVFPQLANYDYIGESASQAIYTDEWAPNRYTSWRNYRSCRSGLLLVSIPARKEQNSGSRSFPLSMPGIRSA